jgi:hypothetical protein
MIGLLVNNEMKTISKVVLRAYLRYYPRICLEGLRKTTKNLNNDSRHPGVIILQIRFYDVSAKPASSVFSARIRVLAYKKRVF